MLSSYHNYRGAFLIRLISSLVSLALLVYGGYVLTENYPPAKQMLVRFLKKNSQEILEPRFPLEQIADKAKKKQESGSLITSETLYYPYALLEVKYTHGSKTEEASMLWSLTKGELITHTKSWKATHGYQDCLNSDVTCQDFQLIKALYKGAFSQGKCQEEAQLDTLFDQTLASCLHKKLIVQKDGVYRLHLANPLFSEKPATRSDFAFNRSLASLETSFPERYTLKQVSRLATALFGADFVVQSSQEIYVPFYRLIFKKQDGSYHSVYYNALTGKEMPAPY